MTNTCLKIGSVLALLCLVSLPVRAQTPACAEWKLKLQTDIRTANACEGEYRICMASAPTSPMRELNYCQNLLRRCESLDGPIEDEALKLQVAQYKQQCS